MNSHPRPNSDADDVNLLPFAFDDGGKPEHLKKARGGNNDCVCRALTIASGKPYEEVARLLEAAGANKPYHRGVYPRVWKPVLTRLGFKPVKLDEKSNVGDAARVSPDACVVYTRHHLAAVVNGVLRDSWDSRRNNPYKSRSRVREAFEVWVPVKPEPKPKMTRLEAAHKGGAARKAQMTKEKWAEMGRKSAEARRRKAAERKA